MWCADATWLRWLPAGLLTFGGLAAAADEIVAARYATPVDRYGHFAAGQPHEYARIEVRTRAGKKLAFELPADEVFEDVAPRIVSLAAASSPVLLAIVSQRERGAALALVGLENERLTMLARSSPIGIPNRWLNPVAVADLDGDGAAEIAAVITPHIGGTLKIYRRAGRQLKEVAALSGFSNHVYGSPELGLSAVKPGWPRPRLLVPDATRTILRIVAFDGRRLQEVGRCLMRARVIGPISAVGDGSLSVVLEDGVRTLSESDCAIGRD